MIRKIINWIMLFLIIGQMLVLFFDGVSFAAPSSKKLYINWDTNSIAETAPTEKFTSTNGTKSFSQDISSGINGVIKSCTLTVNGEAQSNGCTFPTGGTSVTITATGALIDVFGRHETDPGHHMFRLPNGDKWEHKAIKTPKPIQFEPIRATFQGGIKSEYPGKIPLAGNVKSGGSFNYGTDEGGIDLRYTFSTDPDSKVNSYNYDGDAVTSSYEATPPSSFYFTPPADPRNGTGTAIPSSKLIPNTVKVYGASQSTLKNYSPADKPEPYAWGTSTTEGKGMFKVRRHLSGQLEQEIDWDVTPGSQVAPYGEDRNYFMSIDTQWSAQTYVFSGYIDVTYEPPATPDLAAQVLKVDNACIPTGSTQTIRYSYKNIGVSTSTPFIVELKVDGVVVETENATGGANNGVLLGGTFSYKFSTAAPKTFTLAVDEMNKVGDSNRSNNIINKTFTPQATCEPVTEPEQGTMTGTLTIQKPFIDWKENNVFTVEVEPQGCTLDKFKWTMSGIGGAVTMPPAGAANDGWYNNTSGNTNGYLFSFDNTLKQYPGNIQSGKVTVSFTALDSCGAESIIGPKDFEIGQPPPNHPPELRVTFTDSTGEPISSAIVGDTVGLKVTLLRDPDGDPVTFHWDFEDPMNTTEWVRELPPKHRWPTPYTSQSYSGMTADVVGMQVVCAYAADGVGSTNACANLDVIPPNPIPKIKGQQVVKVDRPLTIPWDSNESYSPVPGRTIDHTRDEWINVKRSYSTVGTEKISLNVFDTMGLKSLTPDTWDLTVIPDQPPVIEFQYSATVSRVGTAQFKNASYSPDGDTIVQYRVTYGYDANNNGVCTPTTTTISSINNVFGFKPDKVGKYCFRVYAKEDYGKDAYKDYVVEAINDSPEVTFTASGETTEPGPVIANGIVNNAFLTDSWINTSMDKPVMPKFSWRISPNGTLITGVRDSTIGSISPGTNKSPLFMLPYSSGTPLGGFGTVPYVSMVQTPDYYLGNNMFLIRGNRSMGWNYPNLYITGLHLPKPIELLYFDRDTRYRIFVKEDIDELIVQHSNEFVTQARSYDITLYWKRYKISSLRGGNTTPEVSSSYRMRASDYWAAPTITGTMPTYSDNSKAYDFDVLIKFNHDYKTIDLTNRVIKSYTLDNLTTPYKTETYTDVPSSTSNYLGGPTYYSGVMAIEGYRMPNGNVYYTDEGYFYRFDGNTGKPYRVPGYHGGYFNYPTITAVNDDETVIQYRLTNDSSSSTLPRYLEVATGVQHYGYVPAGFNTNFTSRQDLGFEGASNGLSKQGGMVVETKTFTPLWDTGCGPPNTFHVFSENIYVACGQIYSFAPSGGQTPNTNEYFTFGQLMNPSLTPLRDGTIQWGQKANATNMDFVPAGMSFRIQDHKNMYRLESMKNRLRLIKVVNGRKTTISETARSSFNNTWYNYQVRMTGDRFRVYENGTLLLDITDAVFASGTYGPFSIQEYTEFRGVGTLTYPSGSTMYTNGYAVVDTQVKYEHTFTDPENDPKFDNGTQWKYTHVDTTIFLDAGDRKSGLSARHGTTATTPVLSFDKVGVYKLEYRAPDDPHPNHKLANGVNAFKNYSKYSDWYVQQLVVHRAPISNFTLSIAPDKTVAWTDYSYDPDRCYAKGNCQAPYADTSGVFAKKFYYITPSGNSINGKLVRPGEAGTYTVGMAIQDEYGAWSAWYEQTIHIAVIPPPNVPPTVSLTFPTGTQANPTPVSLQPTITWNQADANPGTIFTAFNIMIKDEYGYCVECLNHQVMETTGTSWAWTMDNMLLMGQKYSAQVQVSDGEAWSSWSSIGWMTTNRPPAAYMSYPFGTQASPTLVSTTRPTLTWSQTDPDPGTVFRHFQIQITNEANTVMILDSGKFSQNNPSTNASWTVPIDLPAGQKLRVRVKVWDQYGAESNWSPQAWLYINRPPNGSLTFASPIYEHDTPAFTITSSDPDGDALSITVESSFNGGAYSEIQQWASVPPDQQRVFTYGPIPKGDYTFRLTLNDGRGGVYQQIYSFVVLPLNITGWVGHTPEWESYRQTWNAKYPQQQREAKDFWAGEAFELAAQVTDTGESATKPEYVDAALIETGETVLLTGDNGIRFTGQLMNTDHVRLLQNGEKYTFRFKVRWTNGLEQMTDVTIRIIGGIYDVIVNQIRH